MINKTQKTLFITFSIFFFLNSTPLLSSHFSPIQIEDPYTKSKQSGYSNVFLVLTLEEIQKLPFQTLDQILSHYLQSTVKSPKIHITINGAKLYNKASLPIIYSSQIKIIIISNISGSFRINVFTSDSIPGENLSFGMHFTYPESVVTNFSYSFFNYTKSFHVSSAVSGIPSENMPGKKNENAYNNINSILSYKTLLSDTFMFGFNNIFNSNLSETFLSETPYQNNYSLNTSVFLRKKIFSYSEIISRFIYKNENQTIINDNTFLKWKENTTAAEISYNYNKFDKFRINRSAYFSTSEINIENKIFSENIIQLDASMNYYNKYIDFNFTSMYNYTYESYFSKLYIGLKLLNGSLSIYTEAFFSQEEADLLMKYSPFNGNSKLDQKREISGKIGTVIFNQDNFLINIFVNYKNIKDDIYIANIYQNYSPTQHIFSINSITDLYFSKYYSTTFTGIYNYKKNYLFDQIRYSIGSDFIFTPSEIFSFGNFINLKNYYSSDDKFTNELSAGIQFQIVPTEKTKLHVKYFTNSLNKLTKKEIISNQNFSLGFDYTY